MRLEIRCSIRLSYAPSGAEIILPALGAIPNGLHRASRRNWVLSGKKDGGRYRIRIRLKTSTKGLNKHGWQISVLVST
jgi:hypothetical protein